MKIEMRTPEQMKAESEAATRKAMSALGAQARSGGLPSSLKSDSEPESGNSDGSSDGSSDSTATSESDVSPRRRRRHGRHRRRRSDGNGARNPESAALRELQMSVHRLTVEGASDKGIIADQQTLLEAANLKLSVYAAANTACGDFDKASNAALAAERAIASSWCSAFRPRPSTDNASAVDALDASVKKTVADAKAAIAALPEGPVRESVSRVHAKKEKDVSKAIGALRAENLRVARWSRAKDYAFYAMAVALLAVLVRFIVRMLW
jgi:hypothetical protein